MLHRLSCGTLVLTIVSAAWCYSKDIHAEYHADIVIPCDHQSHTVNSTFLQPSKKYWLFPNGKLVDVQVDNRIGLNSNFSLSIDDTKEDDYGVYYCLAVWEDGHVTVFDVAFNIDGPDHREFYERMRNNAVVGAISGVVLLVVIATVCGLWHCYDCYDSRRYNTSLVTANENIKSEMKGYSNAVLDLQVENDDGAYNERL